MKTFDEVYPTLPANGWLAEDEARLLWNFASQFKGSILEVGCYFGRSTVLLANLGRPLYCVDPFDGFTDDFTGDHIQASWQENLKSRDLSNVMQFRVRVENWVSRPIVGFAYLDGDHTYEGTRAQIRAALNCGARGIAVHDVSNSGGGLPITRATSEMLGKWTDKTGTLAVWRRK